MWLYGSAGSDMQKRPRGVIAEEVSALPDDTFLTTEELGRRWKIDAGTLANARSRSEGCRFLRLPTGAIRYRLSDVLKAETEGERGFTWHRLEQVLARYPRIKPVEVVRIMEFLQAHMVRDARERR